MAGLLRALGTKVFGINLHEVDPGKVYRVARRRLDDEKFAVLLRRLSIRTAVDLRRPNSCDGPTGTVDFAGLGVRYETVHVRSSALPFPKKLSRYVQILDSLEYPALLYCKRGTDKSGFASMLYLMLVEGAPVDEARGQLAFIPFGHRKKRHEGPWEFMKLLAEEHPADLRTWITDRYPALFKRERPDEEEE